MKKTVLLCMTLLMEVPLLGTSTEFMQAESILSQGTLSQLQQARKLYEENKFPQAANVFSRLYQEYNNLFAIPFLQELKAYIPEDLFDEIGFFVPSPMLKAFKDNRLSLQRGSNHATQQQNLITYLDERKSQGRSTKIQNTLKKIDKKDEAYAHWMHLTAYMGEIKSVQKIMFKKNPQNFPEFFIQLAKQGEMPLQILLAQEYFNGTQSFRRNEKQALFWRLEASKTIDTPESQKRFQEFGMDYDDMKRKLFFLLGWQYEEGMGTEIDPSQAKYWFKKAIEMGNIESKFRLAELLEDNSHRQARKLILEIISNTHLLSPYQKVKLAKMMYDQRFGLQRDGDTIFTLCTQANDHRWLGICYDDGLGVKPNYTKAREHFECAIEEARSSGKSVDSEIFHRLGLIYFKGKEVLQNNDQAVFYLEKAVQGGNLNAMSTLAHIVEKGWENVKPDSQKAMELYTQAAQAGDMIGQYNLGFFYANERNNQEARFWLEKAQNQGYHLSKDILLLLNLFDDKKPEPQTIQELITLLSTEASFSHNMIIQTISKLLPYILDISDQKLQKSFKKQLEALLIPISEDKDIFLSGCAGYLLIYLESVSKISEEVSNSPQKQDNVSLEIQEAMERRKIEKLREKEIKQRAYLEKIRTKNIPSVEITQEIKNLKNSFTPRQIEELEEFINHKGVVKTQELSKILSILDAQRTANGYKIEIGDIITTFHTQHGRDSNVVDPAIVKSIKAGLKESGI